MKLYISGPSENQSCDHFFDIAAPLIPFKMLQHLHCLNLVCHREAFGSVSIKMLVGFSPSATISFM